MAGSVLYRPEGTIGRILIAQPAKRNAISASMWHDLGAAALAAECDPRARVVVVAGEGDDFAAGADISEFQDVYATPESALNYTKTMLTGLGALEAVRKPTIATIRGSCIGGGCSIALACDFRFAASAARFAVTPAKLGLVYSIDDTRRLAAATGAHNAKDLLMTGRMIAGEDARRIGLVDRLCPADALDGEVASVAAELAALSPWSLGATKAMFALLAEGARNDDPRAHRLMLDAFEGDNFKEGYRAFLEKRPPKF